MFAAGKTKGVVNAEANYIESCFSTYLYTGNGGNQTITNGIDLAGKGGMVWQKTRSAANNNWLFDTVRGDNSPLSSNNTNSVAQNISGFFGAPSLLAATSTGFNINTTQGGLNSTGSLCASWTFRKQPKFFDVVTYTGNGAANRVISHNLQSRPGFIVIKCTSTTSNWFAWHRLESNDGTSNSATAFQLNATTAPQDFVQTSAINSTTIDVTVVQDSSFNKPNVNGATYVAYLFAHNAGGFGLTGTDNVISCGSYTGNGSSTGPVINLGYEPQWLLVKNASAVRDWFLMDNMRGFDASGNDAMLFPNLSDAESVQTKIGVLATGFQPKSASGDVNTSGSTYIYIAIRRGPMKVPTDATKVFSPVTYTGDGSSTRDLTFGFPVDMFLVNYRGVSAQRYLRDRLRGGTVYLSTPSTSAEAAIYTVGFDSNTGINDIPPAWDNASGFTFVDYGFRRAPSFFDEVCWTGDGTNPRSLSHNLTVAPTLIITKKRNSTSNWTTGYDFTSTTYKYFFLNDDGAANADTYASTPVYGGNPTASVFIVGNQGNMNISGDTYVSYLFATCPGVSKVGSYTGTGTTLQVNCGFTGGARFVLIKKTSGTGSWYVWDSARGIVSGNDPYLLLNSTAAEVTNTDYIDTYSAGFEISSTAAATVNVLNGTYIYLAIA